ncbi:MAG: GNAT family N-acetyltransferase [Deltaproteobacteria bacterium]|nr:GNAT family N-acetyltransferase [Deltaproteobacteria bacterium]
MLRIRPLESSDIVMIKGWPSYVGDMEQMDFALREAGWLDEFRLRPGTFSYVAEQDAELIAFTMLGKTDTTGAEFRIAVRADRTSQGLGEGIAILTLRCGFQEHRFSRIHLIVRKNNGRAIRLYRRVGFSEQGECQREIRGVTVDFWLMGIEQEEFARLHRV